MPSEERKKAMATSAAILIQHRDGHAQAIYCHGSGAFEDLGRCLLAHYQVTDKVKELIALGGVSYVEAEVAPNEGTPHSFNAPAQGVTVAYIRDRGDNFASRAATTYANLNRALWDWVGGVSYVYVFDEAKGEWRGDKATKVQRSLASGKTPKLTPLARQTRTSV